MKGKLMDALIMGFFSILQFKGQGIQILWIIINNMPSNLFKQLYKNVFPSSFASPFWDEKRTKPFSNSIF